MLTQLTINQQIIRPPSWYTAGVEERAHRRQFTSAVEREQIQLPGHRSDRYRPAGLRSVARMTCPFASQIGQASYSRTALH